MNETRKLAAILAADIAGYGHLAGADEERTLVRLRALRGDLIDPEISVHHEIPISRSAAFAPVRRVAIQLIGHKENGLLMASARPGCRRDNKMMSELKRLMSA
jgi:class 3 adenylate cyclase